MRIEYHFAFVIFIIFVLFSILCQANCNSIIKVGNTGNAKLDDMPIWGCPGGDRNNRLPNGFNLDPTQQSLGLYDKWSFTHITHGYILFALLYSINNYQKSTYLFYSAIFLEIFWEVFENRPATVAHYRKLRNLYRDYVGDSLVNIVSDILFTVIGFILSWYLPLYVNITFVLISEFVAYYTINDSVLVTLLSALIKGIYSLTRAGSSCYNVGMESCFSAAARKLTMPPI